MYKKEIRKNNGKIEFSFEMTNQSNIENISGYTYSVSEAKALAFQNKKIVMA